MGSEPTAMWPDGFLDAAALHARGWRPVPLREFVLKVHQRCNLACAYCYVYTMADQSWRDRPAVMSPRVWRQTALRIAEHARTHRLSHVSVVLHGGEPLLAGAHTLAAIATCVREALPRETACRVSMQTNGILLSQRTLDLLLRNRITVAVSLDGSAQDNDRHRRHADGRGSSAEAAQGLARLAGDPYRTLFGGLLCTIDPQTDPVAVYEALLHYRPPGIDVLLPHANWATGKVAGTGAWLARLFDRWFDAPAKETTVRLFDEIVHLHLGGRSSSEHVGLSPAAVAVVETDGDIEQTDALRSTYAGASATGLSIFDDPFDAALRHPGFIARQLGPEALCHTCQRCPIRTLCGAGHYAHRFHPKTGFLSPTVYCEDMMTIINHVGKRMRQAIADHRQREASARV